MIGEHIEQAHGIARLFQGAYQPLRRLPLYEDKGIPTLIHLSEYILKLIVSQIGSSFANDLDGLRESHFLREI